MRIFKNLVAKVQKPKLIQEFSANLEPHSPLYIIGDVHGRIDLLDRILAAGPQNAQIIFVGDLIDRGEDSSSVLIRVKELCYHGAICLMGNHEKMMLDFLDNPIERGPRWLRYGGLQTLQNYGIRGVSERAREGALLSARDRLEAVLQAGMIDWLKNLPLHWSSGNIHVVHAAADPTIALNSQDSRTLLWGASSFWKQPRTDGQWVVHGHTVVEEAAAQNGRISIDTGAYATNVLTAIHITHGVGEFIST